MRNIIRWFSGIIITLLHVEKKVTSELHQPQLSDCHFLNCNCLNTTDGKRYANCFDKGYETIPTELGNIQILNISANPLIRLSPHDMNRYPEIIELNMHSIKTFGEHGKLQWNFLQPLKKLEVLIIGNMKLLRPPIVLPPTLKILNATLLSRNVSFINFSVLKKLTHLEMHECSLHALPNYLPKEAPLKQLHININYLDKLRYIHLADYCLLEYISMDYSDLRDDLYYHCCDILIWLDVHKISTTLECLIDWTIEPCLRSNFTPDPRALVAHEQCLIRNGLLYKTPHWVYLIIFYSLMAFLLIGYMGFKYYQHYRSKKAAEDQVDNQEEK